MSGELIIRDLSAGYGARAVVRGINAHCRPGQLSCILGANGAGKTTLLRAISGYLSPTSGTIHLGDIELSGLKPRQRARYVAAVPQVTQDVLPLTVREAVRMARYPHLAARLKQNGADARAVDAALAALELGALADQPCARLSGGEWRRVLLAQGFAQETPVLLLDEPTAFLDPPAQRRILTHMRLLAAERGQVAVAVLHAVDLAREFADHVLLLRAGELLAEGAPATTLTPARLAHLYDCQPEWLGAQEVLK